MPINPEPEVHKAVLPTPVGTSRDGTAVVIIACVASVVLVLVTVMCLLGVYLKRKRLKAKERAGAGNDRTSSALNMVKVPSQAGVIQAEYIEFVLPYTSAEPTDEEFSEQDTGGHASPSRPSSNGNLSGSGLLTVPQHVRRVIKVNSIAPALYLSSEGEEEQSSWLPANMNFGKVGFSIRYKYSEQRLTVTIIGAKGLPMKRKTNHPHVKVVVLPDKSGKAFTKVQKNTADPTFNEEFEFSLGADDAAHNILKISACDFDKFSRRIALGHVFFPLKSLGISKDGGPADVVVADVWKNLYPKHMGNEEARGELSLSLCYCPEVRTLRLGIHKVKNLNTGLDEKDIACLYAKLTLFENDKIMKTKKTAAKRKTLEPDFEESFNIKIARKQLKDVVFSVSVCSRNRYGTRKVIGRTQIGPYTRVSGPGADHWSDALQSPNSTVTQWHTLH